MSSAPRTPTPFDRGNRTYRVSAERLHAFGKLSLQERLRWVEESAQFIRMAQAALKAQKKSEPNAQPEG